MKKQIKLLLISGIIAAIILFITATGVKAATTNIPATYGAFVDDFRTDVTFTLPEDITGVEKLETDGWTVTGDTATKEMTRGSSFYYEQTNSNGDVYKVVVAVPMKYSTDETIRMSTAYTNITVDDSEIAEVEENSVNLKAPGRTKLRAQKSTEAGTVVDYVWDLTVVDPQASSEYYNPLKWLLQISEEDRIALSVGDEKDVLINATLDDSEVTAPTTASRPFSVEWVIGDSTIVELTSAEGDKITTSGKIGSAKLKALKAGTTNVTVIVRMDDATANFWTVSLPVTVSEATTPEETEPTTTDENATDTTDGQTTENTTDTTTTGTDTSKESTEAKGKIVQAGSNVAIVLVIIAGFAIIAIISKKKLNK